MVITTYGKEQIAIRIGSNITAPAYISIGSGSQTTSLNVTGLKYEHDRNALTGGSMDYTSPRRVRMIANWSSTELSGLNFSEFGVFVPSSGNKTWSYQGFASGTFDGLQEMEIEETYEVY